MSRGGLAKYGLILGYARPHWAAFAALAAATGLFALAAALQPWPMQMLVDQVLGGRPPPPWLAALLGPAPSAAVLLAVVTAAGLAIFALQSVLDAATSWGWTLVGRRMVFRLAGDLTASLQRRSVLYHRATPIGETLMRITGDSWSSYKVLELAAFAPLRAVLGIGFMAVLMAQANGLLTVVVLLTAPVVVAASTLGGARLRRLAQSHRTLQGGMRAHLQQVLTGIPVVQAFGQEDREEGRFRGFADASVKLQQQTALVGGFNTLASGLIASLGVGLTLWIGAREVLADRLTVGALLVFVAYLPGLQRHVRTLAAIYPEVQQLSASVARVHEALTTPPEVRDRPGAAVLSRAKGAVSFEGVSFAYGEGRGTLSEISLEARPGERVALVGPTGAGKTTLVSLIPRFFDPTAGRVLLDGQDVRDVRLADLRAQVSLVLQEPFLFPLSVAENIAYGRPGASRAEIEAAARAARADEFIARLPDGYETVLGERGATLSGGERQRLSIARALIKDAPILILDEPTSALDAATEALILEALDVLMQGRTTFIIAHRLSTVRKADRILMLDEGRIVERGTHDELIAKGGLYSRLNAIQAGAEAVLA